MKFLSKKKSFRKLLLFLFSGAILFTILSFVFFPDKIVNAASVIFGVDPDTGDFIVKVDGQVRLRVTAEGVLTVGEVKSNINAGDVSSGQFGSTVGGGDYSFSGNLGIGTAIPSAALDVAGNVKADNLHPITATLWPDEFAVLAGSFSYTKNLDQIYGGSWTSNGTDGTTLEGSFFLKSGPHQMYILGESGKNNGKIDWYIDGSLTVTGQDWYANPASSNVRKSQDVTIVNDGVHTIKAVVNGKNPSSTSYVISLTKIWFNTANPAALPPSSSEDGSDKTKPKNPLFKKLENKFP